MKKRIRVIQISQFFKQLAALLQAKIPLSNALITLSKVYQHETLGKLILQIQYDVSSGMNLSSALDQHSKYFSTLTCQLIRAGEQSAALPLVLELLCAYQEKSRQLVSKVKKALFYPVSVLCVALIITIGLLMFIIPQFEHLFISFGATLPWFTRCVLSVAKWIKKEGVAFLFFIIILISVMAILSRRFQAVSFCIAKMKLKIPIAGRILMQAIIARFSRTIAITTKSGVPILQALQLGAEVSNHPIYKQSILTCRLAVSRGESLSNALQDTKQFSPLVIQMVSIGEQSGRLSEMLQEIALWYEAEIDQSVSLLSQCLEPIIMIILGIVIGSLVIAMYLPVFQLGNII